jgi:hypothetical protein
LPDKARRPNEEYRVSRAAGDAAGLGPGSRVWLACGSSFVEDRIKVRGGEMRRRLILMCLALATMLVAQDNDKLYFTDGEANGIIWRSLGETVKAGFLTGLSSGASVLKVWAFMSDFPAPAGCADKMDSAKFPEITNKDLAKEVDKFYQTASNIPLPVSVPVILTYMRLTGATPEQLEKYRAFALKTYLK